MTYAQTTLGRSTGVGALGLVLATALASGYVVGNVVSIGVDVFVFAVNVGVLFELARLVFSKNGHGHAYVTVWRIVDAFVGNVLALTALNMALWSGARLSHGAFVAFSRTHWAEWPAAALADMVVFTTLLTTGAGLTENMPVAGAARLLVAAEALWNYFASALVLLAFSTIVTVTWTKLNPRPIGPIRA